MEKKVQKIILIFFISSLLGWIMETLLVIIAHGTVPDRGAICLPFCVIYGSALTLLFITLGFPKDRMHKLINKKIKNKILLHVLTFLCYFIVVFIVSFIVEYLTGYVIDKIGSKTLWDYNDMWGNINGYVALPILFLFGLVGTIYMYTIYPLLYYVLDYIPIKILLFINFILSISVFWSYILLI